MITIDTKAEKTIITCNTCKKNTIKVDGVRSKRAGYAKAIEAGWRWKNANTQICPTCRKNAAKANGSEKPAAKKTVKPSKFSTKAAGKKGKTGSTPITAGQSIGKLARTAKVSAAPAAE